jgi:hypothetical protein
MLLGFLAPSGCALRLTGLLGRARLAWPARLGSRRQAALLLRLLVTRDLGRLLRRAGLILLRRAGWLPAFTGLRGALLSLAPRAELLLGLLPLLVPGRLGLRSLTPGTLRLRLGLRAALFPAPLLARPLRLALRRWRCGLGRCARRK